MAGWGWTASSLSIDGNRAEIDVRGKRIQAKVKELRVIGAAFAEGFGGVKVRVNLDLKPREGMLSELNVIGMTVDQAVDRVSRFLDDTLVTDLQEVRIVHGHGTGQLRKGLHGVPEDASAGAEILRRAGEPGRRRGHDRRAEGVNNLALEVRARAEFV